jgi:polyphosphate glucokinase
MDVLVIDVGGSHVKMTTSGVDEQRRFRSGTRLTPEHLVERVSEMAADWKYDVISLGVPGAVNGNQATAEPGNLGDGWVGFDFRSAFGKPVRLVNDAVMQALGGYEGGRMLFLGLGTGVGSALITEHVVVPLELGCLTCGGGDTIGATLGRDGFKTLGREAWMRGVRRVTMMLKSAFAADQILLGGGNAKHVSPLPKGVRRGGNGDAFRGGFRLWEELVEPHDRTPPANWRVVR